jgi:hypothetical protein
MSAKLNKINEVFKAYRELLAEYLNKKIYHNDIPENPLHDDLYLVSFPKSGITWLTFLMANVHLKMSGSDKEVTFYNINDFIPDIHQTRNLKTTILSFPGHRVIKSHAEFNPLYKKIFYLMRDPRDVMVSYYWFLRNLGEFNGDLSQLIHSPVYGIASWCRHVQGWVERSTVGTSIDFLRYEDIKADPLKVLTRIYTLMGFSVPEEILQDAMHLSSLENMKRLESEYNYGGDFRFPGFKFVRKGETGGYKTELSENDINFINQQAATWLSLFHYH